MLKPKCSVSILYILGILNSSISTYYLKQVGSPFRGGYFGCDQHTLRTFPIRQIDFAVPAEKKAHDRLVAMVEKMLEVNKKLVPMRGQYSHERDALVKEIEKTDMEIDNLVYDLYGLTEEEVAIVEGSVK